MKQHITETTLKQKLASSEPWVRRALIRIWERQTRDEQSQENTKHRNGEGFTPADAKWFTRMAEFVTKFPERTLSVKQLGICGIRTAGFEGYVRTYRGEPAICKYAGQLLRVMEEDKAVS